METTVAEFREKRSGAERRSGEERRKTTGAVMDRAEGEAKRNKPLEVMGSIVAAALGIFVYRVTGLYSAVDSVTLGIVLGALIVLWFVLNFRIGLHQK